MPYCPLCDVKFKSKSGLQGHFRFKHKIESRSGRPATESVLTRAIGKHIERMRSGDALMREIEGTNSESRDKKSEGVMFRKEGGEGKHEEGNRERRVLFRNK